MNQRYTIEFTNQFKRKVKLCKKRGYDTGLLRQVITLLATEGALPKEYYPHKLSGDRDNQWECHIKGNWLLTWKQDEDVLTLLFLDTGTHADIFGKTKR